VWVNRRGVEFLQRLLHRISNLLGEWCVYIGMALSSAHRRGSSGTPDWSRAAPSGEFATGAARDAEFDALFERHRMWLVRLATLLIDDQAIAEDVVQTAYLGLYKHWRRRDEAESVAYLRASVVNGSRSALRHRKVDRAHLVIVAEPADYERPPNVAGPERLAELADQRHRILAFVGQLPRRQREVLVLRYWAELSEAEIATTLGISAGTVKSSASRGIATLAQRWERAR
jgi:RNA polymerase sigma-70 factor (sigma-E family)